MAKCNNKACNPKCVVAEAKESAMLRALRIDGSQNGASLRTRIVRDKTKYKRNFKHKKSFADAGDFPFLWAFMQKQTACVRSVLQSLFASCHNS